MIREVGIFSLLLFRNLDERDWLCAGRMRW